MSGMTSGALLGMSTATATVVIVVVVVLVLLVVILWAVARSQRRSKLRSSFGPEYDVAVTDARNRRTAERDLQGRLERHDTLPIRPLTAESQSRYLAAWDDLQARFVDRPQHSVIEADELIRSAMVERGYPAQSFEQQVSDLSVEHASTLSSYREAHDLATRSPEQQTTEDLRRAMLGYRQLFVDIVGVTPREGTTPEPATRPSDVDLRDRGLPSETPAEASRTPRDPSA
jgi:predicted RND superfamily exporter protein